MRLCNALIVIAAALASPLHATVINFEGLPDSTVVTNQYTGLTFNDAIILTAGISLNEFEFPPHSGINVVSDNGRPLSIAFASPVSSVSGYFTYAEPITLTGLNASSNKVVSSASAFSNNMALSGFPGSSPNELISLSFPSGLSSVTITGDPAGGSFALDDLTYSSGTATPEPATFLFVGLAIAGMFIYIKIHSHARRSGFWIAFLTVVFVSALGAQTIVSPQATPSSFFISTSTTVTVEAQISPTNLITGSVNIVRYDISGTLVGIIGQLYDDGTHGDVTAGDGMFTGQVELAEPAETLVYFKVSAAYKGLLARVLSDFIEIKIIKPLTQQEAELPLTLPQQAAQQYQVYLSQGASEAIAKAHTLSWILAQPGISQAGPSDDSSSGIWILYTSGITGGVLFNAPDIRGGGARVRPKAPQSRRLALKPFATSSLTASALTPSTAIILDPFPTSDDESASIALSLNKCPMTVTGPIKGKSADLNAFSNLQNYDVIAVISDGDTWFGGIVPSGFPILFHTPGNPGLSKGAGISQVIFATGQIATVEDEVTPARSAELKSGNLVIQWNYVYQQYYYALTPFFISDHYGHKNLTKSIVYIGACRSYFRDASGKFNTSMADAFIDGAGSSTYFGYSDYVLSTFSGQQGTSLFRNLYAGQTTGTAFDNLGGRSDPFHPKPPLPERVASAQLEMQGDRSAMLPNACRQQSLLDIRNDDGQPGSFLLELPEGQPPFAVSIPNNSSHDYNISDLTGAGPFTLKIKATAGFAYILVTLPTGFQFLDGTTSQEQFIVSIIDVLSVATFTFETTPTVTPIVELKLPRLVTYH